MSNAWQCEQPCAATLAAHRTIPYGKLHDIDFAMASARVAMAMANLSTIWQPYCLNPDPDPTFGTIRQAHFCPTQCQR